MDFYHYYMCERIKNCHWQCSHWNLSSASRPTLISVTFWTINSVVLHPILSELWSCGGSTSCISVMNLMAYLFSSRWSSYNREKICVFHLPNITSSADSFSSWLRIRGRRQVGDEFFPGWNRAEKITWQFVPEAPCALFSLGLWVVVILGALVGRRQCGTF